MIIPNAAPSLSSASMPCMTSESCANNNTGQVRSKFLLLGNRELVPAADCYGGSATTISSHTVFVKQKMSHSRCRKKLDAGAKDYPLPTILNQSPAGNLYQWMEGSGCRRPAIDPECLMLLKADAYFSVSNQQPATNSQQPAASGTIC